MNEEKQLAHDIVQTDLRAQYDAACKRLLTNKIILAHIHEELPGRV